MFTMQNTSKTERSLLDLKDQNGDILKYFVLGLNVSKFQKGVCLKLKAQEFFNLTNIEDYDFFQPTMPFPVFSCHAKEVIEACTNDIDFVPCEIFINGIFVKAFAGRILNFKPVFVREGEYAIKVRNEFIPSENDFIIRDSENEQFYFVTERFRKLCSDSKLKIRFIDFSMFK
ncbi:hypothetical protein [Iodobacter fluviatilis]|uniref:Uncharacterized protein n=1 Tax=Iodobacter fluviatilis TaxID=537 RepID=A0A377SU30_9NEIS|nr:hypothetical protein [Iodobacter fluviatilis]TCU81602.1 hypothetical protein EV682_1202 [Iodobacter fluviatilis]STR44798.1 Uncharacterised protein [Iodobacter fluviatilis]